MCTYVNISILFYWNVYEETFFFFLFTELHNFFSVLQVAGTKLLFQSRSRRKVAKTVLVSIDSIAQKINTTSLQQKHGLGLSIDTLD